MIAKKIPALAVLACALALAGCGAKQAGAVDYSVSAQKNYDKGLKELEDKEQSVIDREAREVFPRVTIARDGRLLLAKVMRKLGA